MRGNKRKIRGQASRRTSVSIEAAGSRGKPASPVNCAHGKSYKKGCALQQRPKAKANISFRSVKKLPNLSKEKGSVSVGRRRHFMPKVSNSSYSKMRKPLKIYGRKTVPFVCNRNNMIVNKIVPQRKTKKRKGVMIVSDEASRLQRRTRYLLVRMKLEQNLIDAYLGEGWKGHSREKIKPEKELQRAKKQILRCKLGIRDAIRQLDMLSSEGSIRAIGPDGSVFHEHIFCSKCKIREAFPDNDIILCDGTCNRAFHQKCLEPPLATENIPPGDQGWFCKFCDCKMEILEAVNAHLDTCFPLDSIWQDVFKEAAVDLDDNNKSLEAEWPSEDSEDDDYDPERIEANSSRLDDDASGEGCSSSCSLWSYEEGNFSGRLAGHYDDNDGGSCLIEQDWNPETVNNVGPAVVPPSGDAYGSGFVNFRRQRKIVDYKKLHDEMFGKDTANNEQLTSEDDDWRASKRKRMRKEANGDRVVNSGINGCSCSDIVLKHDVKGSSSSDKKPDLRLPANVVEKTCHVFDENELPSMSVKESLSQQLGTTCIEMRKAFENTTDHGIEMNSLKEMMSQESWLPASGSVTSEVNDDEMYLIQLNRLFKLEDRIHKLLVKLECCKDDNLESICSPREPTVIYVPVAEVREKA